MAPSYANGSGLKSLDKLGADPRVASIFKYADGIWVYLVYGYKNGFDDPVGALHIIHENTVKDVLMRVSGIKPCACKECRANMKAVTR